MRILQETARASKASSVAEILGRPGHFSKLIYALQKVSRNYSPLAGSGPAKGSYENFERERDRRILCQK